MAEVRRLFALCSAILFVLALRLPVRAAGAFSFSLSAQQGDVGDTVGLSVSYDGSLGKIGAFSVRIAFDPKQADYQSLRKSAQLANAYTVTQKANGLIEFVYVQREEELCVSEAGEMFSFRFRINDDAYGEEVMFRVSVDQVVSPSGADLGDARETLAFSVNPEPSGDAALLSLIPSEGTLSPDFSPNQFNYVLSVPFEVTSMGFSAEAAEGASWKVNRKNLGAGGSDTEFLLTVTAEDGISKAVYRVTVHREEKLTAAATKTPAPTATPKAVSTAAAKTSAAPKATKTPKPTVEPKSEAAEEPTEAPAAPTVVYKTGNDVTLPMVLLLTAVVVGQVAAPIVSDLLRGKFSKKNGKRKENGEDEEIDDS